MARSFNGSSDWINIAGSATGALDITGNMTVSCWANTWPADNAGIVSTMVEKGFDGSTNEQYYLRFNASHNPATLDFGNFVGGNTTQDVEWSGLNATHTSGTYVHFCGVYNGVYTVYSNGISRASSASLPGSAHSTANVSLGAFTNAGTPSRWLTGKLADVGIWNVALSASEISALANGARPYTIRPLSLVGFWPLDGIQSPEPDLSGSKFNGTVTGTVLAAGPPIMPFTPRWPRFLGWTPMLSASGLGWIINRRNKLMVPKKRD